MKALVARNRVHSASFAKFNKSMGMFVDLRPYFTYRHWGPHCFRVSIYSFLMCESLGLPYPLCDRMGHAAYLHDPGKFHDKVKELFTEKKGVLTPQERELAKEHVVLGIEMMKPLESLLSEDTYVLALDSILFHHCPYSEGGEKIPLIGRVVHVADAFDTMLSRRSYKKKMTRDAAERELASKAGHDFDPQLVEILQTKILPKRRWLQNPQVVSFAGALTRQTKGASFGLN